MYKRDTFGLHVSTAGKICVLEKNKKKFALHKIGLDC